MHAEETQEVQEVGNRKRNTRKRKRNPKVWMSEFHRLRLLFELRYLAHSANRHGSMRPLKVTLALNLNLNLNPKRNPNPNPKRNPNPNPNPNLTLPNDYASIYIYSCATLRASARRVRAFFARSEMEVPLHYPTTHYHPLILLYYTRLSKTRILVGKTNTNGHRVYTGVLPHRNPLLCPIFAFASFLLFRFLFHGEKFPKFNDKKNFFNRFVLSQTTNCNQVTNCPCASPFQY